VANGGSNHGAKVELCVDWRRKWVSVFVHSSRTLTHSKESTSEPTSFSFRGSASINDGYDNTKNAEARWKSLYQNLEWMNQSKPEIFCNKSLERVSIQTVQSFVHENIFIKTPKNTFLNNFNWFDKSTSKRQSTNVCSNVRVKRKQWGFLIFIYISLQPFSSSNPHTTFPRF
jgi:hypothetical protein